MKTGAGEAITHYGTVAPHAETVRSVRRIISFLYKKDNSILHSNMKQPRTDCFHRDFSDPGQAWGYKCPSRLKQDGKQKHQGAHLPCYQRHLQILRAKGGSCATGKV